MGRWEAQNLKEVAAELAAKANEILRVKDYGPHLLSATVTLKETDGGEIEERWQANMGDYSSYPHECDSLECALERLSQAIGASSRGE